MFFRLWASSFSQREWASPRLTLKACFQSGRRGDDRQWVKRTKLDGYSIIWKQHSVLSTFLGTMRPDKRIRRSRRPCRGDWNILRPATWKSSTYERIVSAFFFVGNFRGTWKFWILFDFHRFYKSVRFDFWTINTLANIKTTTKHKTVLVSTNSQN